MREKKDILQFITQFQISVKWLEESEKNNSSYLREFKKERERCSVFNIGVLIAYAYMCLVLPQESDLFNCLEENDNISELLNKMDIEYNYNDSRSLNRIVKHFRNAIAHANIEVGEDQKIILRDQNVRNNENATFSMQIGTFGTFIDQIYYMQKEHFFEGN